MSFHTRLVYDILVRSSLGCDLKENIVRDLILRAGKACSYSETVTALRIKANKWFEQAMIELGNKVVMHTSFKGELVILFKE